MELRVMTNWPVVTSAKDLRQSAVPALLHARTRQMASATPPTIGSSPAIATANS